MQGQRIEFEHFLESTFPGCYVILKFNQSTLRGEPGTKSQRTNMTDVNVTNLENEHSTDSSQKGMEG